MKHLHKTKKGEKDVILLFKSEEKGSYYYGNNVIYHTAFKKPSGEHIKPCAFYITLFLGFLTLMFMGEHGWDIVCILFNLAFIGMSILSLKLSVRRNRKLIFCATKIDLCNLDDKAAYEIKWLIENGDVGSSFLYFWITRLSVGFITLSILSIVCYVLKIGSEANENLIPMATVLLEFYFYCKIFKQEYARKESISEIKELLNEYEVSK